MLIEDSASTMTKLEKLTRADPDCETKNIAFLYCFEHMPNNAAYDLVKEVPLVNCQEPTKEGVPLPCACAAPLVN